MENMQSRSEAKATDVGEDAISPEKDADLLRNKLIGADSDSAAAPIHFEDLSDDELVSTVRMLATRENESTALLVRSLAEVDQRRLYLRAGCASLYTWCTQVIGLAEGAAWNRIEVARAGRRAPELLEALDDGSLTLTSARLLAPHVTPRNASELIGQARQKSTREVQQLVAAWHPLQDEPWTVTYLSPGRVRLRLTVSDATHDKMRRAVELLRHANPTGDVDEVIDRGMTLLIAKLERDRCGSAAKPRPGSRVSKSRYVPRAVRRAVWARDGGQCAFVGTEGRCAEKGALEYHHLQPYAAGGPTTADNLELRCPQHNRYEADVYFGPSASDAEGEVPPGPT